MFLIGGALTWGTYNGIKFLVYEPDVQWDKKQRGYVGRRARAAMGTPALMGS